MADTTEINIETVPLILRWLRPIHWNVISGEDNLNVEPLGSRETLIDWKRIPKSSQISSILIQKASNQNTGWYTIGKRMPLDKPEFIDFAGNNTFHRHNTCWYRLVIPDSKTIIGPVTTYGYADAMGSEIARRHLIKLSLGKCGNECWVFTRMSDGPRCPECWDELAQARTKAKCNNCNGTGYIQGYYNPTRLFINFPQEAMNMQTDIDGPDNAEATVQCWTGNVPVLNDGDIVIESGNIGIWEIQRVIVSTMRRVVTKQVLTMSKCTGDDPVWNLVTRLPKEARRNGYRR